MKPTVSIKGGDRLRQKLEQIRQRAAKRSVLVGVPKDAGTGEDGTPLVVIAATQEFGSSDGRIPERSFLRVPFRENRKEFARVVENLLPGVIEGRMSIFGLLSQLGAKAVTVSQEAISAGIEPPNAESTIARKGSSKPLIDEGTLRQSITYVIREAGD